MSATILRLLGVLIIMAIVIWAFTTLLVGLLPAIVLKVVVVVVVVAGLLYCGRLLGLWT